MSKEIMDFKKWVVYQVYPRSFKDTNGDGIGDLNGITEKLDYLRDLGVNAVWLSPCYKSPNDDNGYDISDYCDIMDEFGTLDDWKIMISEMHKRGIKLIMDFVANHTSSDHWWFKEARKSKDNPFRDYYYWVDNPPNDWKACFGGSAWQYDELTDQYYLHSYAVSQPDLNWENPKVREEMISVIDFWVNLGVDGFRCDVLDQISKDFVNNRNGNGPKLHDYIKQLFGRPEVSHVFTVGECWGAKPENIKQLIGSDRGELTTVFQFEHINLGYGCGGRFDPKPLLLDEVRNCFVKWQKIMQDNDLIGTLFLENHDQPRCVSKYGNDTAARFESATMLATMCFLQKGIPFLYQGQEIGTANYYSENINDFRDIETINFYNDHFDISSEDRMNGINYGSRDNSRHPMSWSAEEHAGFSANEPWIPVYNRYKEINVSLDMISEKSVYQFYKKLIALRTNSDAFINGKFEDMTGNRSGMYIYGRKTEDESFVVVCNFEMERNFEIELTGDIVLSNYGRESIGGFCHPYECFVVKCARQ